MFKLFALFATLCLVAAVSAGLVQTHAVVHEPVLAKVGTVVHSAPSAVSHQSFTRVHNSAIVQPIVAPVVKTTLHAAPAVVPIHAAAPIVHTYAATPIVHSVPVVHTAPVVKTILPAAYALHH